ncbi:hypothetical protein NE237_002401 [Protea cynaroides]|uniref:Uncharacterized protein n=1 Tax=Protea cynaroides TaxID=273540 RepID=A0A9Q0QZF8_9MAGN|nr:hypothetical protein NE237_002401 [Protea cynaroides]
MGVLLASYFLVISLFFVPNSLPLSQSEGQEALYSSNSLPWPQGRVTKLFIEHFNIDNRCSPTHSLNLSRANYNHFPSPNCQAPPPSSFSRPASAPRRRYLGLAAFITTADEVSLFMVFSFSLIAASHPSLPLTYLAEQDNVGNERNADARSEN